MDNKELVRKTINSDDFAPGGKLSNEQSDRFLDFVFLETMLAPIAREIRFTAETMEINKLGLGRRAALPAAEAEDPKKRRKVTTSKVTLTPVEIMVPLEISDIAKELNIEGEGVVTHILQMFARKFANDVEELNLLGDTRGILDFEENLIDKGSSTEVVEDSYLKLYDGLLRLAASGGIVDHGGDVLSSSFWRLMLKAMPSKFKKNKRDLIWLVPVELDELWRDRVSTRGTGLGDTALNSEGRLTPFGIEMWPMPLLDFNPRQSESLTFTGDNTSVQLAFAPISDSDDVIVINEADADVDVPALPFILDTDYSVDQTLGTVTHISTGAIVNTANVRITYRTLPQIILTRRNNIVVGIGRDVRMETDRNIFKRVDEFAITAKVDIKFEEDTAVVLGKNISEDL